MGVQSEHNHKAMMEMFSGNGEMCIRDSSLSYLKMERLQEMACSRSICTACFSGKYPIEPPVEDIRGSYDK